MGVSAHRTNARPSLALALLLVAGACGKADKTPASGTTDTPRTPGTAASACPGSNADITTPAGFCATVFADSIPHGRDVIVAPNGDVYVTLEGMTPGPDQRISGVATPEPSASFAALRDTNHDGRADIIKRVGSLGNTGIGIANGYLYVDEGARVVRYARADTALVPSGKAEVVVLGIPLGPGHRARNFTFGFTIGPG